MTTTNKKLISNLIKCLWITERQLSEEKSEIADNNDLQPMHNLLCVVVDLLGCIEEDALRELKKI